MILFANVQSHAAGKIDLLGSWVPGENMISQLARPDLLVTHLSFLKPFVAVSPWTKALEGKRVLVVHPFSRSVGEQYKKERFSFLTAHLCLASSFRH